MVVSGEGEGEVGEGGVEGVGEVLEGDGAGNEPAEKMVVEEVVLACLPVVGLVGLVGLPGGRFGGGEVGEVAELVAEVVGGGGGGVYDVARFFVDMGDGLGSFAVEEAGGVEEDGFVGEKVEGEEVVVVGGGLVGVEGVGKVGAEFGDGLGVGEEGRGDAFKEETAEKGVGVVAGLSHLK